MIGKYAVENGNAAVLGDSRPSAHHELCSPTSGGTPFIMSGVNYAFLQVAARLALRVEIHQAFSRVAAHLASQVEVNYAFLQVVAHLTL